MIEIPIVGKSEVTLVDDDFLEHLPLNAWQLSRKGYVQRSFWIDGRSATLMIHRLIMNAPSGVEVDHRNGNKLDNRRFNLRLCTHAQNQRNRQVLNRNNSTGVKGVYRDRRRGTFYAQVTLNGKATTVASGILTIQEAAKIRDEHAARMHGEFFAPCCL